MTRSSRLRCERRNRGVLLWHRSSSEVIVAVLDKKRGGTFEVPVAAGQRALDVFLYRFAHRRSSSKPDLDLTPLNASRGAFWP